MDWPSELYNYQSLFYLPIWVDKASFVVPGKPAQFGGLVLTRSEMRSDLSNETLGNIYKRVGRATSKFVGDFDEYGLEAMQSVLVRMH